MGCFLNISNHPSSLWSEKQKKAAENFGPIIDISFPDVNPSASEEEINAMAEELFTKAMKFSPSAVMCQGEFTLSYCLISMFLRHEIKCLAACTERRTVEVPQEDGTIIKTSLYDFVKFREYGAVKPDSEVNAAGKTD